LTPIRQGRMDIRGKTYRVELIVSNFIENFIGIALTGTTVWGNDRSRWVPKTPLGVDG